MIRSTGYRKFTDRERYIQELQDRYAPDDLWTDGPVHNRYRRVTDKFCCFVFLLYMLLMVIIGIWALTRSKHSNLHKVYDSSGNVCGRGDTSAYPYLYMQNFRPPYRSVCVKSCPHFNYNAIA